MLLHMARSTRGRKPGSAAATRGGDLLRAWIARNNETQASIAERLGVSQKTVSEWIRGVVPQVDDAARIEAETGVPVLAWALPFSQAG